MLTRADVKSGGAVKTVEFLYDALGRRAARRVDGGAWRWYFYDGLQVVAEGTGVNDRIFYTRDDSQVGGIIARDTMKYFCDRLGNVIATGGAFQVLDAFGNIQWKTTGLDWASGSTTDRLPHGLTTKEFDSDLGLYYFNARWYDPAVGRFVSQDAKKNPTGEFLFCMNNSSRYIDPTGQEAILTVDVRIMSAGWILSVEYANGTVESSCPERQDHKHCSFHSLGAELGYGSVISYFHFTANCYIPGVERLDADAYGGFFKGISGAAAWVVGPVGGKMLGGDGMVCDIASNSFGAGFSVGVSASFTFVYNCGP